MMRALALCALCGCTPSDPCDEPIFSNGVATSCIVASDCPEGTLCLSCGACVAEDECGSRAGSCTADEDCEQGLRCDDACGCVQDA